MLLRKNPSLKTQETEEIEEVTNGVETTAEELEGYHIVRAILAQITDANRGDS